MSETSAWVARRIRDTRNENNLSQGELARRTGHTQAAVSLWEGGKRTPGLDDLIALAEAFSKPVSYFFPPEETRQPIAMLLRATADRIAGPKLRDVVDTLLVQVEGEGLPQRHLEVKASSPIRAADELLQQASVIAPPVDVEQLARGCGALVATKDMSDGLSGLVFRYEDGAVIAVNSRHSANRQRFSIAHELGHYLLEHHERFHIDVGDSDVPGYDWQVERAANEFAAELLMPHEFVRNRFDQNPAVFSLAQDFKVSELAMGYRLVNLRLK